MLCRRRRDAPSKKVSISRCHTSISYMCITLPYLLHLYELPPFAIRPSLILAHAPGPLAPLGAYGLIWKQREVKPWMKSRLRELNGLFKCHSHELRIRQKSPRYQEDLSFQTSPMSWSPPTIPLYFASTTMPNIIRFVSHSLATDISLLNSNDTTAVGSSVVTLHYHNY